MQLFTRIKHHLDGVDIPAEIITAPGMPAILEAYQFRLSVDQTASPPSPPATTNTAPRYQVMTTVPENWIPFLPVHVDGNNRTIQLQRAAMPRILEGDPNPARKVQPRTVLLRNELDDTPPQPYFVHEEEIPGAGTRLTQAYQRTRWTDGQVYTGCACAAKPAEAKDPPGWLSTNSCLNNLLNVWVGTPFGSDQTAAATEAVVITAPLKISERTVGVRGVG
jgi:hypothetical protein